MMSSMFLKRRSSLSLKVWAIFVCRMEVKKFLLNAIGGFAGTKEEKRNPNLQKLSCTQNL